MPIESNGPPAPNLAGALLERRANKAVQAALTEIDGAADETTIALMAAALLALHAINALAALDSREKAQRMYIGFVGDLTNRVIVSDRARRELLELPGRS